MRSRSPAAAAAIAIVSMLAATASLGFLGPVRVPGGLEASRIAAVCAGLFGLVLVNLWEAWRGHAQAARVLPVSAVIYCGCLVLHVLASFIFVPSAELQPSLLLGLLAVCILGGTLISLGWSRARARTRRVLVITGLGVLGIVTGGLLVGNFIHEAERETARRRCPGNLLALGAAFKLYLTAHQGRFPDSRRWADALYPFLDDWRPFWYEGPVHPHDSDHLMNPRLSRRALADVSDPTRTVLLYCKGQRSDGRRYPVLMVDGSVSFLPGVDSGLGP